MKFKSNAQNPKGVWPGILAQNNIGFSSFSLSLFFWIKLLLEPTKKYELICE